MSSSAVSDVNYIYENGIKILKGLPLIDISKLKKNPQNIKLHPKEQIHDIMKQMKMVGFIYPIVIDKELVIWAGHGKLESGEGLGMKRVPYTYLENLTEDQKKVFMVMDNKVNESSWVSENLKTIFDEVDPILFNDYDMNFNDYFQKNSDIAETEWTGMPEFIQEDDDAYRRIIIKFDNEKNLNKFIELTNAKITEDTKWIWFPHKKQHKTTKEYTDES